MAQASGLKVESEICNAAVLTGLKQTLEAGDSLVEAYVVQRSTSSGRVPPVSTARMYARCDGTADPRSVHRGVQFRACADRVAWIEPEEGNYQWQLLDHLIERCIDPRTAIIGGPLLTLPAWVAQMAGPLAGDILNLPSFVSDFVETAINRYTGRIRMWEIAAYEEIRGGALALSEEHRLAVIARAMETALPYRQ